MPSHFLTVRLWRLINWLMLAGFLGGACLGQTLSVAKLGGFGDVATGRAPLAAAPMAASPVRPYSLPETLNHPRFWDKQNRILFSTVAALSAADFAVTRSNLQNGGKELNPVTRLFSGSTAGLAINFAGETAGIVGISYYLHKTGHHRLERMAPLVNIGTSAFAVGFDLGHR